MPPKPSTAKRPSSSSSTTLDGAESAARKRGGSAGSESANNNHNRRSGSFDSNSTSGGNFVAPNNTSANSGNNSNNSPNNISANNNDVENEKQLYPADCGSLNEVGLRSKYLKEHFEGTLDGEIIASEIVEDHIINPVLQFIVTSHCDRLSVPWTVQWLISQMNEVALMYLTTIEGSKQNLPVSMLPPPEELVKNNNQKAKLLSNSALGSSCPPFTSESPLALELTFGNNAPSPIATKRDEIADFTAFTSPTNHHENSLFVERKPKRIREPGMMEEDSWCRGSVKSVPKREKPAEKQSIHEILADAGKNNKSNNNNNNNNSVEDDDKKGTRGSRNSSRTPTSPTRKQSPVKKRPLSAVTPSTRAASASSQKSDKMITGSSKILQSSNRNQTPDHLATVKNNNNSELVTGDILAIGIPPLSGASKTTSTRPFSAKPTTTNNSSKLLLSRPNSSSTVKTPDILAIKNQQRQDLQNQQGRPPTATSSPFLSKFNQIRGGGNLVNNNNRSQTSFSSVFKYENTTTTDPFANAATAAAAEQDEWMNLTPSARAEKEAEREFSLIMAERKFVMQELRETSRHADEVFNNLPSVPAIFTSRPQTPVLAIERTIAPPNANLSSNNPATHSVVHAQLLDLEAEEARRRAMEEAELAAKKRKKGGSAARRIDGSLAINASSTFSRRNLDKNKDRKVLSPDLFFVPEKKSGAAGSGSMVKSIVPAAGVTAKTVDDEKK